MTDQNTRPKTVWPKLIDGHTYRFTFTNQYARPGTPVGATHSGTWTVTNARTQTAGAFRAFVMRWTARGSNTAVITDLSLTLGRPVTAPCSVCGGSERITLTRVLRSGRWVQDSKPCPECKQAQIESDQ